MVVNYLNFIGVALAPNEANAPSVVDADAVLAASLSF